MKDFWELAQNNQLNVNEIKKMMDEGFKPHEIRGGVTPLSYLVKMMQNEEVDAVLNHPNFDYAPGIAYFLRAVMDKVLEVDDPVVYQIWLSEQLKKDLNLETLLMSNASLGLLTEHLKPILAEWAQKPKVKQKAPVASSSTSPLMAFMDKLANARDGGSIDLPEGIDFNTVLKYTYKDEQSQVVTPLSFLIKKKMDAQAIMVLSNPTFKYTGDTKLAWTAAQQVAPEGAVFSLLNEMKEAYEQNLKAEQEAKEKAEALAKEQAELKRQQEAQAKEAALIQARDNAPKKVTLTLMRNLPNFKSLLNAEIPAPVRVSKNGENKENISAPDAYSVKGGFYQL